MQILEKHLVSTKTGLKINDVGILCRVAWQSANVTMGLSATETEVAFSSGTWYLRAKLRMSFQNTTDCRVSTLTVPDIQNGICALDCTATLLASSSNLQLSKVLRRLCRIQERSQNFEKLLLASSCLSVCLSARSSVRPHGTTRLPLDRFS